MFSMGLTLVAGDFKRVLKQPLAVCYGLGSQMLLLPLLAFALVELLQPAPAIAIGVIILAASPGGITSNLLTHLASGDSALSITLTAISSLAGVITVPLIVGTGLGWYGAEMAVPSVTKMVTGVFLITTLPLLLGMWLRHRWPRQTAQWQPLARRLAISLFLLIVVATFMGQWGGISAGIAAAGPAVIALNLLTMGLAASGAYLLRLQSRQRIAITLECGLQNAAMGIFVASSLLADSALALPSIIYALVMNGTAALFILISLMPAGWPLLSRTR